MTQLTSTSRASRRLCTLLLGGVLLLVSQAWALDLSSAKQAGLIGEMHTGYLAVVKDRDGAKELVAEVNAKRKAHYQKIADKNGISLLAVEVRAGQKAIEKSASGALINTGEGWEAKP